MPDIDFFTLGYLAYPSARNYPTRDKNNLTSEMAYINGWNTAKKDADNSDQDSEFGRDTYAAHYLKAK